MTRLQAELRRLYLPTAADATAPAHLAQDGMVRALVLEVARPAGWDALAAAWTGVQADLELPAPAIAVNGTDGCQLWFSLAHPVPQADAVAWLDALRARYLVGVRPDRITAWPSAGARPLPPVPALQPDTGHWSAFVAPDLAPLFAEEPWLDLTPGDDAQADLLSRLVSIAPDAYARSTQRLRPEPAQAVPGDAADGSAPHAVDAGAGAALAGRHADPRQFLLAVMNDAGVPLHLRIEAARALLPLQGQM